MSMVECVHAIMKLDSHKAVFFKNDATMRQGTMEATAWKEQKHSGRVAHCFNVTPVQIRESASKHCCVCNSSQSAQFQICHPAFINVL